MKKKKHKTRRAATYRSSWETHAQNILGLKTVGSYVYFDPKDFDVDDLAHLRRLISSMMAYRVKHRMPHGMKLTCYMAGDNTVVVERVA